MSLHFYSFFFSDQYMFIFSRSKGPWVPFVFILIVTVGALVSWQSSLDEDGGNKEAFMAFEKTVNEKVKLTEEQKQTGLLFEVFKCRKPSPSERQYCNKVADKFYEILTPEQRESFIPIVQEFFSK